MRVSLHDDLVHDGQLRLAVRPGQDVGRVRVGEVRRVTGSHGVTLVVVLPRIQVNLIVWQVAEHELAMLGQRWSPELARFERIGNFLKRKTEAYYMYKTR